jgi:hypothetical protein
VPPPAASPQRTPAEIETLVAPIALFPDPLIATILPASVYPLEIVTAARFVRDTNNLDKVDDQPWDDNVKEIAKIPAAIELLNTNLSWTVDLGQAFLEQQEDVMDSIQSLRAKAQNLGTLQTTPQQVVIVTNIIVEKTVEQQIVHVTNTIVQIVPSNPQIIYVPTYPPYWVYYPRPPYYIGPPPLVTFAVGVSVGFIWANNCNWHHRGIYVGRGGYYGRGNVNVNVNVNKNVNINANRNVNNNNNNINNANRTQQKWQPEQSRLSRSGAPGSTATAQARGWNSGDPVARTPTAASRPSTPSTASRVAPSTQPSRPSTSTSRPASSSQPASPTTPANRPATSTQPSPSSTPASRPATSTTTSRPSTTSTSNRPATSRPSGQSAFGGVNSGQPARDGSRGSASSAGGRSGARR